jgi:hypothetical protein
LFEYEDPSHKIFTTTFLTVKEHTKGMLKLELEPALTNTEQKFSILHPKGKVLLGLGEQKPSYARPTLASSTKVKGANNVESQARQLQGPKSWLLGEAHYGGEHSNLWHLEELGLQFAPDSAGKARTPREIKGSPRIPDANPELLRHVKERSAKLDRLRLYRCGCLNFSTLLTPSVSAKLEYLYLRGNRLRTMWDTSQTPLLRL